MASRHSDSNGVDVNSGAPWVIRGSGSESYSETDCSERPKRLVSGLYAEVRLETERLQDRLVVPDDAVLVRQGRDLGFVIENGRAQWSYVELGARSGERVEITDGVAPRDTIAVDGHFALAHDASVRIGDLREFGLE